MKNLCLALALFLTTLPAAAQSATGTYRFVLEDRATQYLDFKAVTDSRGVTTGDMGYIYSAPVSDVADPDDPRQGEPPPEVVVKATFDSLTIEKNRALMRGTVVDSSHRTYIGKWVQLVVEDYENRDQLTWSFCPQRPGWIPQTEDGKDDRDAWLSWWATDAERQDDPGIPSRNLLAKDEGCEVHSLWVYPFAEPLEAEGDIIVRP